MDTRSRMVGFHELTLYLWIARGIRGFNEIRLVYTNDQRSPTIAYNEADGEKRPKHEQSVFVTFLFPIEKRTHHRVIQRPFQC